MARINLTDKYIESSKRVPASGRVDYHDALVPGLAMRVSSTGHRAFILVARYPSNPKNPTRRALGDYGAITLEQARVKAREWLTLLNQGTDPKIEETKRRAAALRSQQNNFGYVAEEFLKRYVKGPSFCELERLAAELRKAQPDLKPPAALRKVMADPANRTLLAKSKKEGLVKKIPADTIIRAEFIKKWHTRPITEILPEECASAIRAIVDRGTPGQAHTAFEQLRRLYSWAIGTNQFGVTSSPVATLRPADLIGHKEVRNRVLIDAELRAVWDAAAGGYVPPKQDGLRVRAPTDAKQMNYPYGPLIRLLILTGQRENEVAGMRWSEVDFEQKLWTIPADRMKGKEARTHEVPLAPDTLALLKSLPRFKGDYVFTTTDGAKPVNGFSKAKERIDKLSEVKGWIFHDLRRTARTHFSALPVPDMVRELVIAHAQPALHQVYDQHSYRDEKRECLTLWEARLRGILAPKPPAEVTDLESERVRRVSSK
jgi:integrase